MDPFQNLPSEIHIEILVSLYGKVNTFPIIRASPCMLATYQVHKNMIRRRFYATEFDDRMIQDAVALTTFPFREVDSYFDTTMYPVAKEHADRWMSQGFPCPFKHNDRATLESLDKLYDHLLDYIPKYFTTSPYFYIFTSCYLPKEIYARDCMWLEEIGPAVKKLGFNGLRSYERKRLCQIFLRLNVSSAFADHLGRLYDSKDIRDMVAIAYPMDRDG